MADKEYFAQIPTITQEELDSLTAMISSDTMTMDYTSLNAGINGTYSIGNVTTPYVFTTNNTGNIGIGTTYTGNNTLQVQGDAEFEGDVKIKGKSILKMLETIEKRLAILQPDPEKLEHFEALQKAYEHYKTLEALCELPAKTDKE